MAKLLVWVLAAGSRSYRSTGPPCPPYSTFYFSPLGLVSPLHLSFVYGSITGAWGQTAIMSCSDNVVSAPPALFWLAMPRPLTTTVLPNKYLMVNTKLPVMKAVSAIHGVLQWCENYRDDWLGLASWSSWQWATAVCTPRNYPSRLTWLLVNLPQWHAAQKLIWPRRRGRRRRRRTIADLELRGSCKLMLPHAADTVCAVLPLQLPMLISWVWVTLVRYQMTSIRQNGRKTHWGQGETQPGTFVCLSVWLAACSCLFLCLVLLNVQRI